METLIILYLLYPVFKFIYDKYFIITKFILGTLFVFPFLYNFIIVIFKLLSIINLPIIEGVALHTFPRTVFFTMYSILFFYLGAISERMKFKIPMSVCIFLIFFGLIECLFETTIMSNYTHTIYDNINSCFPTIGSLSMAIVFFI